MHAYYYQLLEEVVMRQLARSIAGFTFFHFFCVAELLIFLLNFYNFIVGQLWRRGRAAIKKLRPEAALNTKPMEKRRDLGQALALHN